ncbi:hypothetical protein DKX38_016604 [Salix brachista]|uniref:SGNH hydrolase-type esterase domain-containing protein n=1 Tax=Salix brachista TaxID=2182728 RepID=A0A5N5L9Y3_9ROSI|nr:hypothetical protein DKX38_016604 [Salix brachista]
MNFAFGGTGIFDTFINAPNMSTQIDFFQQLLEEKAYTKQDLNSSIALVSLAGNDYTTYIQRNGKLQVSLANYILFLAYGVGLPTFTTSLISQLSASLKRIHGFGVRKIASFFKNLFLLSAIAASPNELIQFYAQTDSYYC